MKPPLPKKIPKIHIAHGDERVDDYYWLRDDTRKDPEIISYLEEENNYLEDWFGKNNDCRKEIYDELKIKKTDLNFKIQELEHKNSLLTKDIDLDFIEVLIRDKFLFGKDGETTYILKNDGQN